MTTTFVINLFAVLRRDTQIPWFKAMEVREGFWRNSSRTLAVPCGDGTLLSTQKAEIGRSL